jgi:DNA-binding response OmpR family regulator
MSPDELHPMSTAGTVAHHILLVEDDADAAASLKEALQQKGFRVAVVKDGGQAQSTFVMRRPDFVILDLILPGESGFEICERMKQTDSTVPVLVLSVIDLPDARSLADRVGADGYLTKPCDPDVLVETIKSISEKVWQKTHTDRPKEEKRIRFTCRCGKRFKVSPMHRGKTLTCPECGEPLVVPRHD